MVSKKILGVAIAAALSSSAFAADFALTSADSLKVAKSTIDSTTKVVIASPASSSQAAPGDYYTITKDNTNLDFDVAGTVGIGLAADQKIYVRVDLTNAAFGTTVSTTDISVQDSNPSMKNADTVSQGGAVKDKFVVFTVSPTATKQFGTANTFSFTLPNLLIDGSSDVGVKVSFYSSIDNAVNNTSALSTVTNKNAVVKFVDGIKTTFTPSTITADADTLFKKLVGVAYGTKTEVGNIVVAVDGTVATAGGAALTLPLAFNTAADKSVVTLTGDFSNADYSLNAAAGCGAVTQQITLFVDGNATQTNTNNKTTGKLNAEYKVALGTSGLGITTGTTATATLCASKQDNGLVLSPTEFKASIAFDKNSDRVWANTPVASTLLGTLVRNGVTIQVPYLTTFADYSQRLVLVNRGTTAAAYSVAFTPETGVTATAGSAATGSLAAGKTTIIPVTSLVTLTGATRTAATVTVVAADSKIDAATTIVNVSDKSTDTVRLK